MAVFPPTRWSLVQRSQGSEGKQALGQLLEIYWRPLFVLARTRGLSPDQAGESVQSFMLHLLERERFVERLSPERGKLRSYLKTSFRNFLNNEWDKGRAQKRGAGQALASLDSQEAESLIDPNMTDPEQAFERQWAAGLMQRALQTLEAEFRNGQRSGPFEVVKLYFSGSMTEGYGDIAATHGLTVPQLKSLLHRARGRYKELLLEAVGDTLDPEAPGEAAAQQAELQQIRAALS